MSGSRSFEAAEREGEAGLAGVAAQAGLDVLHSGRAEAPSTVGEDRDALAFADPDTLKDPSGSRTPDPVPVLKHVAGRAAQPDDQAHVCRPGASAPPTVPSPLHRYDGQLLGNGVAPIALAFAVLDATGSVGSLGLVVGANSLTSILFLLYGGVLADRLPRGPLLVGSSVVSARARR
ncbi:hypothetical protein [Streptomyces curacoi]|uniref:hypothetical protein n=1 Tax=Streptomyces curacoi TaxID=146536 RepID=UPI001ABFF68A|nr:hypothetical protein [Streptomyces curacoi]